MAKQVKENKNGELERSLSFYAALAIGVGTMVGAGVFVFPGIAAGKAGAAAILSFVLAGGIALLIALCTAELSTAMPESGGGYFFVSRIFGSRLGMVVGIGQWAGLVFACAFYLSGFAQYALELMNEWGISSDSPSMLIAQGTAILLLIINLVGTRKAGMLQNYIVVGLILLLGSLFAYGILQATGLIDEVQLPRTFAPEGIGAVFPTTALIFTSYLGFVQIATVAGEVQEPHKSLPRALILSVVIATVLYVSALFVSTSFFPAGELAEMGETAMVEVGRTLFGKMGAALILFAGLLATLSSANASILSSSRALFALGNDRLIPKYVSRINERFGTPYIALLAVVTLVVGFLFIRQLEILAEVASLLHLVLYGLICLVLFKCRRNRPLWYAPTFRIPAYKIISLLGAAASFGLVFMMQTVSMVLGAGLLLAALVWHYFYARQVELSAPKPPHIIPSMRSPRILMPVEVPDTGKPPLPLLRAFRNLEMYVLGYKITPEQTSPEQTKEISEGEEEDTLEKYSQKMEEAGHDVVSQLVYTPELEKSLDRYTKDKNCQAILLPKELDNLKRLVLPLQLMEQVNTRLITVIYELSRTSQLPVAIWLMKEKSGEEAKTEELKEKIHRKLSFAGLSERQIQFRYADSSDLLDTIQQISKPGNLIILGEAGPFDRQFLFKNIQGKISRKIESPLIVILREDRQMDT